MASRASWIGVALAAALGLAQASSAAQPATQQDGAASLPGDAAGLERLLYRLNDQGRYFDALPVAERLAALRAEAAGGEHPDAVAALQLLAWAHRRIGDLRGAEPLFRRVLEIRERILPAGDRDREIAVQNLAGLYREQQDFERAEPLLRGRLARAQRWDRPAALSALASLLAERGAIEEAVSLHEQALAATEALPSPVTQGGPGAHGQALPRADVGSALDNLALALAARGDLERAAALAAQALAIDEQALGPAHRQTAVCQNNLARILQRKGDLERAADLFRRSAAARERALGVDHPDVAVPLNNLAGLEWDRGDLAEARRLFERARQILERAYGPDHPRIADVLNALAGIAQGEGRIGDAVALRRRAADIQEAQAALLFLSGSERQKQALAAKLERITDAIVSLHVRGAPGDAGAARLAMTTALRRKGLVLDAMAEGIELLRKRVSPEDSALLEELARVVEQRATLVARGPAGAPPEQHRANLERLAADQRRIEAEISQRSAAFRATRAQVSVEEVQAALPEGAALLELVVYRPLDARAPLARRLGEPRYAAYVLRRAGEIRAVDLGEAARIDAAAGELRRALADPAQDPRPGAEALDALVLRPVEPLLGNARQLFVSPDGALGLLPLGALRDAAGRYRVEGLSLSYLTSGRDLPRLRAAREAAWREGPLVLANPDFGERAAPAEPGAGRGLRSAVMAKVKFRPLPGTADEGAAIGGLIAGARVLLGGAASEAALKAARGPRILHLATHGFFLPDPPRPAAATRDAEGDGGDPAPAPGDAAESPLLSGGLALAGANRRQSGEEDGILTALEASTLDLRGTELVVLSACETGIGEVRRGEGVYGLRRALTIAGAEAQVMSLWRVEDEATRDLMVGYYRGLAAGRGRAEALRDVQLSMLKRRETAHPYAWAGFILAGDPSPVAGLGPPRASSAPRAPRALPGPAGCGCDAAGAAPGSAGAALVAAGAAAAAVGRRRRRGAAARARG